MAQRHTYTRPELDRCFSRICLPESQRIYDVSLLSDDDKLSYLRLLLKHLLVKIPWENLTQHYSWHRVVNVKASHLFRKIVDDPCRGGYCMEVNYFHHLFLHNLGFDVFLTGSRIFSQPTGTYGGWSHVVNIATIAGQRYLVDGGFSARGPIRPVPLEHEQVSTQISPASIRLMFEPIGEHLDRSQRVWKYQHRYDNDAPWVDMYCFTELEFTPADVAAMNFSPWLNHRSFFTHKFVACRFSTDKERVSHEDDDDGAGPGSPDSAALEGEINGTITINQDVFKWRQHGHVVVQTAFAAEWERVDALRKYFGIRLDPEDEAAIFGGPAQIGATAPGVD